MKLKDLKHGEYFTRKPMCEQEAKPSEVRRSTGVRNGMIFLVEWNLRVILKYTKILLFKE